jgi:glycine oxidase
VAVNPDVLIIGGGVVGSACARELARAGLKVTVVDPGGAIGQAWQAAAGLLAPQLEGDGEDPLLEVGLAGRDYYTTHRAELEASSGITLGLLLGGIVRLAGSEADAERLRTRVAWQRQHGLSCEWLGPDEVREQWPWLGSSRGALLAPNDGSLDPSRLVQALIVDGNRLGVRRLEDRISRLEIANGHATGAAGRERYSAGRVVVAAGAWSGRLEGLPRPVSVEPIRGQMAAIHRPRTLPDFIAYGHDHYYLLTRGEEIVAGSTMEHAGFTAEVTTEGLAGIKAAADRICPELAHLPIARSWAGLRPGTPDGLPIIGQEPRVQGLWYATGHGRNGVLLAGITAVVLRQQMSGETTLEAVGGGAFRPERFWNR